MLKRKPTDASDRSRASKKLKGPQEGGTLLKDTHPALYATLDVARNEAHGLDLNKVTTATSAYVWWICKSGHSELLSVANRIKRLSNCSICDNDRAKLRDRKEWDKQYPPSAEQLQSSKVCEVQVRGQDGLIVNALCDELDHGYLMQFKWSLNKGYPQATSDAKTISMHQVVYGPLQHANNVIDHIDGVRTNCTRQNLREVSKSTNAQNRSVHKNHFVGVQPRPTKKRMTWTSMLGREHLGSCTSEDSAAYAYNVRAWELFGPHASVNDVQKPDNFESSRIVRQRKIKNVRPLDNGKFSVTVHGQFVGSFATETEAAVAAIAKETEMVTLKDAARQRQQSVARSVPITRNNSGQAVIRTRKGEEILVDAERWHELNQFSWHISPDGYAAARNTTSDKAMLMHRHVMDDLLKDSREVIDHVDGNRVNNQRINLRVADFKLNAHNVKKRANTTSQYIGVSKSNTKWLAHMKHDGKYTWLGRYDSEVVAAFARDCYAIKVYGKDARLNGVPKPDGWVFDSSTNRAVSSDTMVE
jgi:hypothetical protein